jgi:hypothetical protein
LPKPERPAIDELSAFVGDGGELGVAFSGRVGSGPVRVIEVELLDEQGQPFHVFSGWFPWLARPNRYSETASVGHLDADADTFAGFTTQVDASLTKRPARVRVTLGERTELMGEPREADVAVAAPKAIALGSPCDPFEIVNRCANGVWCDAPDGVAPDSPTCLEPVATCPLELPTLSEVHEGSNAASADQTLASCTASRGNLGNEQGHVFVAPAAGTYRFTATSVSSHAATTLFVRRYCQYAHARGELGCAHDDSAADTTIATVPLTLELMLGAEERVYAFVEAWWVNGGDYVLSVEPVN